MSLGYEVIVGHLDHQLRLDSVKEAEFVQNLGDSLGVETIIERCEVLELKQEGFSLEEAARISRYRFLTRLAREKTANCIATGHTADDQVETVLMHFLRGAGLSGLRGMMPRTAMKDWAHLHDVNNLYLVRPLLEVTRNQTEAYCRELGINFVIDPSNQDTTFFRNKIRHELIPYLREYNPQIEQIIQRTAKVMKAEASFLTSVLDAKWDQVVKFGDDRSIRVDQEAFMALPLSLKRGLLRRVCKSLIPDMRDLGFEHIEAALDFLDHKTSQGKVHLPSGLELFKMYNEIVVQKQGVRLTFREYPQMLENEVLELKVPMRCELAHGWSLMIQKIQVEESKRADLFSSFEHSKAAMDVRSIKGSMLLRSINPGDRFEPFGMEGSIKVSDFFINRKIPHPAREFWPLVCDDEGVLWVSGLRISQRVRVKSDTTEMVLMRIEPPHGGEL
jgi:tRNA(Ile)-lysidine synthase